MLYDPKWEVETKADPFSLEGLIAWLERQPASGTYRYGSVTNCLNAQYFKSCGFDVSSCGVWEFSHWVRRGWWIFKIRSFVTTSFPISFNEIASCEPYTFGSALSRARQALAAGEASAVSDDRSAIDQQTEVR